MTFRARVLTAPVLAAALLAAVPATEGWSAPASASAGADAPAAPPTDARAAGGRAVELLSGRVRSAGHDARGRAAVVLRGGRRYLTLRSFRIDPGPLVRVYLVPRRVRSDGQVTKSFRSLGKLKGNRGNQQYRIPRNVDLRRYSQVIFWCVPFTQTLARAQLNRS